MEIKSKFWFNVLKFIMGILPLFGAVVIGVIVGLIWNGTAGFFTFFGLYLAFIFFIMGRQLWWYITKTGDYDVTKYSKK